MNRRECLLAVGATAIGACLPTSIPINAARNLGTPADVVYGASREYPIELLHMVKCFLMDYKRAACEAWYVISQSKSGLKDWRIELHQWLNKTPGVYVNWGGEDANVVAHALKTILHLAGVTDVRQNNPALDAEFERLFGKPIDQI